MLLIIRSALYVAGQIISIGVYTPVSLLSRLLPQHTGMRIVRGWAHFNRWWLAVTCGLTHETTGLEHLPASPCVLLSKHQSAWETIVFQTFLPPMCFVIKRELLWIPFFGWGLGATYPIAIDRGAGRKALEQVLREGSERIDSGLFVCIFPEGTRTAPDEAVAYNPGGAMLATRRGVPVVPVAHNAGCYWSKNGFLKRPGVIKVEFGEVIDTTDRKPRDVNAEAQAWIEARSTALVKEARNMTAGH